MAFKLLVFAALCVCAGVVPALAATAEESLRLAIVTGVSIKLTADVKLTKDLPPIPNGYAVSITGAKNGGKGPVIIDGMGRYSIFKSSGTDGVTLELTNLIITRAQPVLNGVIGAAVNISGRLSVIKVNFKSNARAIYGEKLRAAILSSQFDSHTKTAVLIRPGSVFSFSGCTFTKNKADSKSGGGAIHVFGSYDNYDDRASVTVDKSTFSGNSAPGSSGGAVSLWTFANVGFTDCTFTGNSATNGGAIYANNGYFGTSRSTFSKNSASYGGAINMRSDGEGNNQHSRTTFSGNKASVSGGAFQLVFEAAVNFCNSKFTANTAKGVPNNGFGTNDGPIINLFPPGVLPLVTVAPGLDPPRFQAGESC